MSKLKRPITEIADRPVYIENPDLVPINAPYFTDDPKADQYYTNDATSNKLDTADS